jgi:lysozyme
MKTSDAGIALIKEFEGCELICYADAVGVPTIGYGHTLGLMRSDIGVKTITRDEAERLLGEADLPRYESGVSAVVKVPLEQHQFDALVSFAYNLSVGSLARSTLLRKLNQSDYGGAAAEFPKWVHAGSQVLPGLVRRRAAEQAMFGGSQERVAA